MPNSYVMCHMLKYANIICFNSSRDTWSETRLNLCIKLYTKFSNLNGSITVPKKCKCNKY